MHVFQFYSSGGALHSNLNFVSMCLGCSVLKFRYINVWEHLYMTFGWMVDFSEWNFLIFIHLHSWFAFFSSSLLQTFCFVFGLFRARKFHCLIRGHMMDFGEWNLSISIHRGFFFIFWMFSFQHRRVYLNFRRHH